MSNDLKKSISYKDCTIKIYYDEYAESPREMDNLGCFALFHRRYDLPNDEGISQEKAQKIERDAKNYIVLPVYGYDHGGLTISTKSYSCRWDGGRLGIIYMHKDVARENFGRVYRDKAIKCLELEVKEFDQYLRGEVYGYRILDKDGEEIDSCWGYYGDYEENVVNDAKSAIDYKEKARLLLLAHAGLLK